MSYENFRRKNPLFRKSYPHSITDELTRLAYNAGDRDRLNKLFWSAVLIFIVIGVWCWFSI